MGLEEAAKISHEKCTSGEEEEADFSVRVDDPHTSLEPIVEGPLPSSTSQNLRLYNHVITACDRLSLFPYISNFLILLVIPIFFAMDSASAAERATSPFGTPMPCVFRRFAERYSCMERNRFGFVAGLLAGVSCCWLFS